MALCHDTISSLHYGEPPAKVLEDQRFWGRTETISFNQFYIFGKARSVNTGREYTTKCKTDKYSPYFYRLQNMLLLQEMIIIAEVFRKEMPYVNSGFNLLSREMSGFY